MSSKHYTVDTHRPAPYGDMTEDELQEYEELMDDKTASIIPLYILISILLVILLCFYYLKG